MSGDPQSTSETRNAESARFVATLDGCTGPELWVVAEAWWEVYVPEARYSVVYSQEADEAAVEPNSVFSVAKEEAFPVRVARDVSAASASSGPIPAGPPESCIDLFGIGLPLATLLALYPPPPSKYQAEPGQITLGANCDAYFCYPCNLWLDVGQRRRHEEGGKHKFRLVVVKWKAVVRSMLSIKLRASRPQPSSYPLL